MEIREKFNQVRSCTEGICAPLITEDYVVQSMPDASPVKWHLAHTTWFFETFILSEFDWYKVYNKEFRYMFNSYYAQVGDRFLRPIRGVITRPSVEEVYKYRKYVDNQICRLMENVLSEKTHFLLELGLNHEQQHQELILTDLKHAFSLNPLHPVYSKKNIPETNKIEEINWISFPEGIYQAGFKGNKFCFDNETPRHKNYLHPFHLANRLITNKEYMEFVSDKGYEKEILWLSDGWAVLQNEKWKAPLYWQKVNDDWYNYTLHGFKKINPGEPVCHLSFYEADAFATWYGARLPTEYEWEAAAEKEQIKGNLLENELFHPVPNTEGDDLVQMYGDVWEWTRSSYSPYPGYKPLPGALGEYNAKFMSNQYVLRGGSCVTPHSHIRKTYRNFFPPSARWQFMGLRLAKD